MLFLFMQELCVHGKRCILFHSVVKTKNLNLLSSLLVTHRHYFWYLLLMNVKRIISVDSEVWQNKIKDISSGRGKCYMWYKLPLSASCQSGCDINFTVTRKRKFLYDFIKLITPHSSVVFKTTFSSNGLPIIIFCKTLSISDIVMGWFFPSRLCNIHWALWALVYEQSHHSIVIALCCQPTPSFFSFSLVLLCICWCSSDNWPVA